MKIHNIIGQCDDGRHEVRQGRIDVVAVHRVWFNDWPLELDPFPIEVCRRFIDDPEVAEYTGGENAYTFIIPKDGLVHQALPLHEIGRHARRFWNGRAIGVGVMGDFRKHPPTPTQRSSLVELCSRLMTVLNVRPLDNVDGQRWARCLSGHTELPGGSGDPDKECPGQYLDMHELRRDVQEYMIRSATEELVKDGLVVS